MTQFLQAACRWAAVYLLSLALTIYLVENLRGVRLYADPMPSPTATEPGGGGGEPPNCPPCTEGWLTIGEFYGIECEHGPEHSPGCPPPSQFDPARDCWEENGNVPSPITGQRCDCYGNCVGGRGDCEGEFLEWIAWCGWENKPGGTCNVVRRTDLLTIRYSRNAAVDDPDPNKKCTWTHEHEEKKHCGKTTIENIGCLANVNCKGFGNWKIEGIGPYERCIQANPSEIPPAPTDPN